MLMFTFVGIIVGPSSFGAIVAATESYALAFLAIAGLVLIAVFGACDAAAATAAAEPEPAPALTGKRAAAPAQPRCPRR